MCQVDVVILSVHLFPLLFHSFPVPPGREEAGQRKVPGAPPETAPMALVSPRQLNRAFP